MNKRIIRTCKESSLPYFVVDQYQQIGSTFGERLINAFQLIFDKGYNNVIAVGNDSPTLCSNDILDAHKFLNNKEVVLGPSHDGGIYLIGLTKNSFSIPLLSGVSWQSGRVMEQLSSSLSSSLAVLGFKYDIDSPLTRRSWFLLNEIGDALRDIIINLLVRPFLCVHDEVIFVPYHRTTDLRAPPVW